MPRVQYSLPCTNIHLVSCFATLSLMTCPAGIFLPDMGGQPVLAWVHTSHLPKKTIFSFSSLHILTHPYTTITPSVSGALGACFSCERSKSYLSRISLSAITCHGRCTLRNTCPVFSIKVCSRKKSASDSVISSGEFSNRDMPRSDGNRSFTMAYPSPMLGSEDGDRLACKQYLFGSSPSCSNLSSPKSRKALRRKSKKPESMQSASMLDKCKHEAPANQPAESRRANSWMGSKINLVMVEALRKWPSPCSIRSAAMSSTVTSVTWVHAAHAGGG